MVYENTFIVHTFTYKTEYISYSLPDGEIRSYPRTTETKHVHHFNTLEEIFQKKLYYSWKRDSIEVFDALYNRKIDKSVIARAYDKYIDDKTESYREKRRKRYVFRETPVPYTYGGKKYRSNRKPKTKQEKTMMDEYSRPSRRILPSSWNVGRSDQRFGRSVSWKNNKNREKQWMK